MIRFSLRCFFNSNFANQTMRNDFLHLLKDGYDGSVCVFVWPGREQKSIIRFAAHLIMLKYLSPSRPESDQSTISNTHFAFLWPHYAKLQPLVLAFFCHLQILSTHVARMQRMDALGACIWVRGEMLSMIYFLPFINGFDMYCISLRYVDFK